MQLVDFSSVLLLKDNSTRSFESGFDKIFARVTAIAARNDRCEHIETIHSAIVATAIVEIQKFLSLRSQSVFRLQDCIERSSQTA